MNLSFVSFACRSTVVWVLAMLALNAARSSAQQGPEQQPSERQSSASVASLPTDIASQENRKITIVVHDSTLEYVLRSIARQAGRPLVLAKGDSHVLRRVTLRIEHATLDEAMTAALRGTRLVFTTAADGETLIVRPRIDSSKAGQQKEGGRIEGRAVDSATGKGIENATVTIPTTKQSVVTASDGRFVMSNVPVGKYTVVVKMFGYRSVSRDVEVISEKPAIVHFMLPGTATILSSLVTTATGTQRRIEVGNDIVVLNVDSILRTAPITSVTDILATRVPGLTVQQSGGSPGDPAKIRIRGEGSITRSSEPIIIVDGIRINSDERFNRDILRLGDTLLQMMTDGQGTGGRTTPSLIDQIDPNSIETIEVQKGPSASALYGADAANGVIIITTKKGRPTSTAWSARVSQGVTSLPGKYPTYFWNFGRGIDGASSASTVGCLYPCSRIVNLDSLVPFQALNYPRSSPIGKGNSSRLSTTVNGGRSGFGYSLTGSTSTTNGYLRLPKIEIERFALFHEQPIPKWATRPEQYTDWSITSAFTLQPTQALYLGINQSITQSKQAKSSLSGSVVNDLQSNYVDTMIQRNGTGVLLFSPYHRLRSRTLISRTASTANWQARSWLPLTATVGFDKSDRDDQDALPRAFVFGVGSDSLGNYRAGAASSFVQSMSFAIGGSGLRIPSRWGPAVRVLSGVSVVKTSLTSHTAWADSLPTGKYVPITVNGGYQSEDSRIVAGWYVEPKLDVQSRFFVVPGLRFDGSNASGSKGGLSSFPRLSFSWIASEERFWPFKDVMDLFRLRMALGYAGRLPASGDHLRILDYGSGTLNGATMEMAKIRYLGNTRLVPERTREGEIGFDSELWNNRLSLSVTYSYGVTSDAIVKVPLAPSVLGLNQTQPINIGNVEKHGTEVSIQTQIIDRREIGWTVNGTFGSHRNTITRLADGVDKLSFAGMQLRKGYPIDGVWYYPVLRYADINGNGIIDNMGEVRVADSLVFAGVPYPKFEISLFSNVTLLNGRFSINGNLQYSSGTTRSIAEGISGGCVYCAQGDPNRLVLQEQAIQLASSRRSLPQIADVLTFTMMSVSYNIPQQVLRPLRLRSSSLSLQGRNLGKKTNYRGTDPRVLTGGTAMPREWICNVQLGL